MLLALDEITVTQTLHEGTNSLVYRGRQASNGQAIILKFLKTAYPSPAQRACYRQEYDLTQRLHELDRLGSIIQVQDLRDYDNRLALVVEDFGGQALNLLQQQQAFSPEAVLTLALELVETLAQIHSHGVVHRDINPSNLVLNQETHQLKLIDFGIALDLEGLVERGDRAQVKMGQRKMGQRKIGPRKMGQQPTAPFSSPLDGQTSGLFPEVASQQPLSEQLGSERLEGTLAYLAPEQTGRLNKAVDYRADYYALGVTLYELLTQSLPFEADDPLGLVHCHLAKPAQPLDQRNPLLSSSLSDVVLKLMAKTPEARYQSAHGIHADLEACLSQLEGRQGNSSISRKQAAKAAVSDRFRPGQQDQPPELQLPQRLYGRDIELNRLQAAKERAYYGCRECFLLVGDAGTGKSALVHSLRRTQWGNAGYFISGKFDQLQRDTPYSAIAQALDSLVQQWLSESLSDLQGWRDRIQEALGNNGQALLELIPSLEKVIGPQPSLIPLPPQENDNRFRGTFQTFLQVICREEHPLILFLDDLQWGDAASFNLIQLMLCQPELHGFLLIGALRPKEVGPAHPFRLTLAMLERQQVLVQETELEPLSSLTANQLIADALQTSRQETEELAELVFEKTQGNPFFLKEFLKTLHGDRQLWFDRQHRRWCWDLEQICRQSMTDNVVELMATRIGQLPLETQDCLADLACLGNQVDLATLACGRGIDADTSREHIAAAVAAGLVVQLQTEIDRQQGANYTAVPSLNSTAYSFVHDRIQEAAYGSIPAQARALKHWQIGQRLLKQPFMTAITNIDGASYSGAATFAPRRGDANGVTDLSAEDGALRARRFEVINQLNLGRSRLAPQGSSLGSIQSSSPEAAEMSEAELPELEQQRLQLQSLNLWAGQQAQQTVARQSALDYLNAGLSLGQGTDWQHHYDLTLALQTAAAEAALLAGSLELMQQWIAEALPQCRTALDRAPFYQLQIVAAMMQQKPRQALEIALPAMASLGVILPTKPNLLHIILGSIRVKWLLRGKSDADILALSDMTVPAKFAALKMAGYIGTATYMTAPKLRPILTFAVLQESLRHGPSPNSAQGYASYGIAQAAVLGNIPEGVRFGNLALKLNQQRQDKAQEARTVFLVYFLIRHWQEPLRNTIEPLRRAYQTGLEGGDYEYAATCLYSAAQQTFICGDPLEEVSVQFHQAVQAGEQLQQERAVQRGRLYQQLIACLQNQAEQANQLQGCHYDGETMEKLHLQQQDYTTLFLLYLYRLKLAFLLGDMAEAVQWSQAATAHEESALGASVIPTFHFYSALAKLSYLTQTTSRRRKALEKQIKAHHQKFKLWANHAPMNQKHRQLLIQAERDRLNKRHTQAMAAYDEAIQLAQAYGYRQDEALANELAARFYLDQGQHKVARAYLQDAHYGYQCWGAQAKLEALEQQYANLLPLGEGRKPSVNSTIRDSINREGADLDLMSVTKASQTLSGEMQRDRLLTRLMEAILENAGAEAGYLALVHQQQWRVEAAATVVSHSTLSEEEVLLGADASRSVGQQIEVLQSIPLSQCKQLPQSILNYVIHSHDSVVLGDAMVEHQFAGDPVVLERELRSLLCIPLLHQGKLIGLVYLENNLITDAFTQKRIKVIRLLCSQAAISLDNSRLYAEAADYARTLEQKVMERTAALEQANQELHRLATIDGLTHLANRRSFDDYLAQQWQQLGAKQQPLVVILCDVDYFKRYNDHYGHQAGDHCLQEIARAMERVIKRPNDLVARYGGEEFVIVLPNTSQEVAIVLAEALRSELQRVALPHEKSDVASHVTLSQGIRCITPSPAMKASEIVAQADEALYQAKSSGRNGYACFSEASLQ